MCFTRIKAQNEEIETIFSLYETRISRMDAQGIRAGADSRKRVRAMSAIS